MRLRFLQLSAVVFLTVGAIVLLSPINAQWLQWYLAFNSKLLSFVVDMARVSLIALLLAGLLAPFEALGWWAGWYGDGIETHISCKLPESLSSPTAQTAIASTSNPADLSGAE
ncbi:MAG: hypothetical protein AAFO87_13805, partial [Cyanobacteria bacterium J06607_6]